MAAAVAQHAAESELFVAGELAANRPNKLVVSVCDHRTFPMANDRNGIAHAEEIDDMVRYDTFRRQLRDRNEPRI
jgi:hypothetical protein